MSIEATLERILAETLKNSALLSSIIKGEDLSSKVYDTSDMMKILKISLRTLANYRSNGTLSFSKNSGRIFYTQDDLNNFLKKNHFKSFSNV